MAGSLGQRGGCAPDSSRTGSVGRAGRTSSLIEDMDMDMGTDEDEDADACWSG
ncbi:hypothetical protein [Streptomyces lavendulae]|uniref:hypothetical protein n=1 Tax=Streptomyces lavendulae TaxID=1914 RepID=UPI0024A26E77|nr:hypothetical protein [Streptomyces lavendulae]GLX19709.1 hypothetical protein Slala01_33530 [Streptomyces lavendulae subsp. lavendulae]GLX27204.1 hypothetical protein Slala02_30240 [Streptomyces lavendulae subsp. lavendulae]